MDIVMRPRQGGKTYELVKILTERSDAVLVVAERHEREHIRRMVLLVLKEQREQETRLADMNARRVTSGHLDEVMKRVLTPGELRMIHPAVKPLVLVDGMERVLEVMLDRSVTVASIDVPSRADSEFVVHFTDPEIDQTWEHEREYRLTERRNLEDIAKNIMRGDLRRFHTRNDMLKAIGEVTGASEAEVMAAALGVAPKRSTS